MLWGIHKTEKRGLSTSEWLILLLFAIYQCSYLAISFCTLFLHHQKLSGANNLEVRIYVPHWDILSTHKSCERDQNPRGMLHWLGFQSGNKTVEPDALGQSIGWAHAVKLNLKGVSELVATEAEQSSQGLGIRWDQLCQERYVQYVWDRSSW